MIARGRRQVHSLILSTLKRSRISQATLARRLNKGEDQISRVLRNPSNLELDTISAYLFGIAGASIRVSLEMPRELPPIKTISANTAAKFDSPRRPWDDGGSNIRSVAA
jgi:hypothetical protein